VLHSRIASYFAAQKSKPHFLIEPSGIGEPAPRCPRRRIDEPDVWDVRDPGKKRELLFKLGVLGAGVV
jgi:hypothetical protein